MAGRTGRRQIRARNKRGDVRYRMLEWLACPACRGEELTLETSQTREMGTYHASWVGTERETPGLDFDRRTLTDVVEGALHCTGCGGI